MWVHGHCGQTLTCKAARLSDRTNEPLHALRLLQQVAQVLVELGALQLGNIGVQGLLQVAAVEELGVLKARLKHCFITCAALLAYTPCNPPPKLRHVIGDEHHLMERRPKSAY